MTLPKHDTAAAVDFLLRWAPQGPWCLTAISVDKKAITTATFLPGQEAATHDWIESFNGRRNIYYQVNPVIGLLKKKAERRDIRSVDFLHVDIDPREGENLAEERDRALALLTTKLPPDVPPPTVVVFSGGGYQGFWRLREAIQIDGDVAKADEAALYSMQLETALNADRCHNVDRLMRLPGTINIPDAKKQTKGRTATLAKLVEFHDDRVYPLSMFTPAPAVGGAGPQSPGVAIDLAKVQRLAGVNELDKYGVPDRVKVIIVQGRHPDEPKPVDNSRSAWLFDAVCHLHRCAVPPELIYGIITDSAFKISESVLDKRHTRKYALKQIADAAEEIHGPRRHGVLINPGAPLEVADLFLRQRSRLLHHSGDYLGYAEGAYLALEDQTIRAELYSFLEGAVSHDGEKVKKFNPTASAVTAYSDALRARAHLPSDERRHGPVWLDGRERPAPGEIVACRNGLLHLPSGELHDHTPEFFTRNALEFDHDPAPAAPSRWLEFLGAIWPDAAERDCINCLQEIFGYALTPDTSQQKAFMLVTPKRGGKGTIARVLTHLVGRRNVAAPSFKQLGEQFGLQSLIGKQLAIVSDMRVGNKADAVAITENLLRITGEDMVSVPRKHKIDWEGYLATRFLVLSNELPQLRDVSGAFASRFIAIQGRQTWFGREDPGLTQTLLAELPGILTWAVEGWRRLRARGHFVPPAGSGEMLDLMEKMGSPVKGFLDDECELDPTAKADKDDLFQAFREWHRANGQPYTGSKDHFSKDLFAATGGEVRPGKERGAERRRPVFVGLRLIRHKPF